jgi:hypothetical protein
VWDDDKEDLLIPQADEDGNDLDPKLFINSVTKYLRVRTVEMIDDEYLFCSCGWQSRMMMPCCHIFRIVEHFHPDMYSVIWSSYFQYYYRKNKEYTKVFDEQIREEHNRGFKQDIKVKGLCIKDNWKFINGEDIVLGLNTLEKDVHWSKEILSLQERGFLFVKGIGPVSAENKTLAQYDNTYTDPHGQECSHIPQDANIGITMKISAEIQDMLNKDITSPTKRAKLCTDELALQRKQIEYNKNTSNLSTYQQALPFFSELMKEAENHKDAISDICSWMISERTRLKKERIAREKGLALSDSSLLPTRLFNQDHIYTQRDDDDDDEVISIDNDPNHIESIVHDNHGKSKDKSSRRTKNWFEKI